MDAHQVISTILRHDRKQNSYKIALLRAIGDVALEFYSLPAKGRGVAVPLRRLAEYWIAYYWPFVANDAPVWQGVRQQKSSGLSDDLAFRAALTQLRAEWERSEGARRSSDGYLLIHEMRLGRRRRTYRAALKDAYRAAWKQIKQSIKYPIRYAGPGEWQVFAKPTTPRRLDAVARIPGTKEGELCLVVDGELWRTFCDLSLWVEALCIHEWCLFTETVDQYEQAPARRGAIYQLLTARPDNRRPLTWERNQIDVLLMEGATFVCPWTQKSITEGTDYDIDHLLPLSVYPINELWNLLPTDGTFNRNVKRDRLPSNARLHDARPRFEANYHRYMRSEALSRAMQEDVAVRFADATGRADLPGFTADAVVRFTERVASARNLARF